jgi:uncharacterized protein (DUF342 family)
MASAVIAMGSATISINPRETEARLVFIPNPEEDGWDAAAVNKLASDKQLGAFPDLKALETFLSKAARAKTSDPLEMVFAQGIAPEDPVSEKVNWEALPVPDDMLPYKEEALAKAGVPEIFRVKVEKIRHEKTVKKSGALGLMAGKEEVAVSWEKKETREKVNVNPEVLDIKYAERGSKLGTIVPAVPGKPGKSIFGRPIPPQGAGDSSYLLGEGITREKNEVFASVSGFIRIGENWADTIPLSKHLWEIRTGIDGVTLFLHFEPGDPRFTPPTGEEILANALAGGAEENALISPGELDHVIGEAIKTGEPLEAYVLFCVQEAEARMDIDHEKTKAVLYLQKGVAGALPLEMKTISQVLKESGLHGFDTEKLKAEIQAFLQGKDLRFSYVLLEGIPATRGKDKEVRIKTELLPPEEHRKILDRLIEWNSHDALGTGEFEPKKATGFAFVETGALVASVSSEPPGDEGKDIFGNVIPGLPGNDPEIKLFGGLELRDSSINASNAGLLILEMSEKNFCGEVIEYQDAKIGIHITEDAMEASGDFFREEGPGLPLTVENVKKVLNALGIKKGIVWEDVEKACEQARIRGSVLGCVLAKGELPIAQGGSALRWLVPLVPAEPAGEYAAETHVSAAEVVQIKAGTPILELSAPAAAGRPGYDVKGREIPVDKGTAPIITHDNSVRELPFGKGKRFVAARSGELFFDGKKLRISSTKAIQGDAGPATGDIQFSGEIQISGNVLPGCKVIGGSHVIIGGLTEGAFISAGGKAVATRGFKGDGRGVIRARAGIVSAFVERAAVMAIGDIQLNMGSILSSIKTNGKLSVTAENGRLSGGVCRARQGIDAADIGSERGTRTEISFGQDYLIKDEINTCEEENAKLKYSLSKTEEKLQGFLKQKLPIPDELKNEKIRMVKLQEQINLKLFMLREKFEEYHESEIRIRGTVFPGVVIESHNRYYEVKQKRSRVVFYFDRESGRIKEKPII